MDDIELEDELETDDIEEIEEEVEEVFNPKGKYTNAQLEEWTNQILLEDVNRELCPRCKEDNKNNPKKYPNEIPYGTETGIVEAVPQFDKNGEPLVDENENQLYIDFPQYMCERGHRWYKGEGPRRDYKGPNPFLAKSHLENRMRREIQTALGTADPAYTLNKNQQPGMYNRVGEGGRKQNTEEQRKKNGASFFGSSSPAETWGWRLAQHDKAGEVAPVTTRILTPEELAAIPKGKNALHGEDKRDIRQFVMPK
jgi:hypothetical protein